jgi:hypothetical protein
LAWIVAGTNARFFIVTDTAPPELEAEALALELDATVALELGLELALELDFELDPQPPSTTNRRRTVRSEVRFIRRSLPAGGSRCID